MQIPELQDLEVQCLLKVLSKPELDGNILVQEFAQIMENFGLYDKPKKPKHQLDLGRLDQKSVKIMVMLMLYLIENNQTTVEFFESAIFAQNVKSKQKQQSIDLIKAKDFFRILQEKGIRKKQTEHQNLKEFLRLSE